MLFIFANVYNVKNLMKRSGNGGHLMQYKIGNDPNITFKTDATYPACLD